VSLILRFSHVIFSHKKFPKNRFSIWDRISVYVFLQNASTSNVGNQYFGFLQHLREFYITLIGANKHGPLSRRPDDPSTIDEIKHTLDDFLDNAQQILRGIG
jgi:hypothetical protein